MKNELNNLIREAMLAKDELRLRVLRFIKTEFTKFETAEHSTELTEIEEQKILIKMAKQREESVREYAKAGRDDLMIAEADELSILVGFIPKQPSNEEVISFVNDLMDNETDNMGGYIKKIKAKFPTVDGKVIADIVKSKLNK